MAATVLIVDDHPSFRRFARKLLESGGFSVVHAAADGASGLAAIRELQPDVVLLDVLLPDTTGFELAEVLSADPGGPVVVLTSSRSASDLEGSLARTKAHGFIAKRHLTPTALATVVEGAA